MSDALADPRWHQLQDAIRELYNAMAPDEDLCGVLVTVHTPDVPHVSYAVDQRGDGVHRVVYPADEEPVIIPDGMAAEPRGGAT